MELITLPLGALNTNCYIVYNQNKNALLFDPADNSEIILEELKKNNLNVQGILLTHTHYDHIGALEQVSKSLKLPVYVSEEETDWLMNPEKNGSVRFTHLVTANVNTIKVHEGQLVVGDFIMDVLHTPGHSPGSMTYIFDNTFIISGDVLFNKGVGRTDLYRGSTEAVMHSIKNKLFNLDLGLKVYPGHGLPTTLIEEKQENPNIL